MADAAGMSSGNTDNKYNTETMRFLCRLTQKVQKRIDFLRNISVEQIRSMDRYALASSLTGLNPRSLQILEACDPNNMKAIDVVDRSVVLVAYSLYCLQMRCLPTSKKLHANLKEKIPPYMDLTSFRKMLIEMGFIWKNTGNGTIVVIEKPMIYFERYNYLSKLIEYKKNLPIYYVDENIICHSDSKSLSYVSAYDIPGWETQEEDVLKDKIFILYAISKDGVTAIECFEGYHEDTFENWIMDTLLPVLQEPSLIIFNNAPHNRKLINAQPTLNSLKSEIMDFLDTNNVPYDFDMSKYELYTLSQRFAKVKRNTYKADNLLEIRGHKVLRLPKHIKNLTPATPLSEFIKTEFAKQEFPGEKEQWTEKLKEVLSSTFDVANSAIGNHMENIHEEIDRLYNRDVVVDQIWDEIVTNSSKTSERYEDSDVPILSDDEEL